MQCTVAIVLLITRFRNRAHRSHWRCIGSVLWRVAAFWSQPLHEKVDSNGLDFQWPDFVFEFHFIALCIYFLSEDKPESTQDQK